MNLSIMKILANINLKDLPALTMEVWLDEEQRKDWFMKLVSYGNNGMDSLIAAFSNDGLATSELGVALGTSIFNFAINSAMVDKAEGKVVNKPLDACQIIISVIAMTIAVLSQSFNIDQLFKDDADNDQITIANGNEVASPTIQ